MDLASLHFYLFAGVSLLYVVHFGLYLVGANFYDIWQHRRKHVLGRPTGLRRGPSVPPRPPGRSPTPPRCPVWSASSSRRTTRSR